jgi:dimethylargininase
MVHGLTTSHIGKPDYRKALIQHAAYVSALESCTVIVTVLDADPGFPDGCFVEDTAVLTGRCAIIDNPGEPSRKGEITAIEDVLRSFYSDIEHIQNPGTLEGGDVMQVKNHFYIGLSRRTNNEGAQQLIGFLEKYGYTGSVINMNEMLHLKTGLAYLGKNVLLAAGEFVHHPGFDAFHRIEINSREAYAANCLGVNDCVFVPRGFRTTREAVEKAGFSVVQLDMSEFQKLDGGLSCLSLRF